ncbi:MAG TPA: hypothetical protein VLE95_01095 [Chlamydiales bacterium]|nr:hypothetical protein [Chlamydiales bacterium]
MIYRHRTIESGLKEALRTFPAILVTGSRQAGKTTLLRNLLPDYEYMGILSPIASAVPVSRGALAMPWSSEL